VPPGIQTTAYRIVQESLNNVRRHSGSSVASVGATCRADAVELVIEDRGRGFDSRATGSSGIGLVGLHERAALVGGTCRVESERGVGTRVHVRLPLGDWASADV
jgi:signal transduction histidine kinase